MLPISESYTVIKELSCQRKEGVFKAVFGICWMPDEVGLVIYPCYLTESERQEAYNYHLAARQQAFLKGRYLAKKVASVYLNNQNYQQYGISAGIFGQPILTGNQPHKAGVSISHSAGVAACIVFDEAHPMAIDLEMIDLEKALSIKDQLSQHELNMCRKLEESRPLSYMRLWSMKEALSKVLKTGLSMEFKVLEFEALDSSGGRVTGYFRNFMQYKAISWISEGYVWSMALPAQSILAEEEDLYTVLSAHRVEKSF